MRLLSIDEEEPKLTLSDAFYLYCYVDTYFAIEAVKRHVLRFVHSLKFIFLP